MTKGFVIIAQNTSKVNYVECAIALANSLKRVMPNSSITLITDNIIESCVFDYVILFPYGDLAKDSDWKLINDWQVYEASPYDITIKLEADMYVPKSIDHYFELLSNYEVCVASKIRNYKNEISNCKAYRQFITNNNLPDVYNAMTYFKKSDFARKYFEIVKDVFENWNDYKKILTCNIDEIATTDWAYSIASHIMGKEKTTTPLDFFSFVHMKQLVNDTITEDWTNELVYEFNEPLRIQTFTQLYPVHYHIKSFGKKLNDNYGRI
jgi:hypothetical protein